MSPGAWARLVGRSLRREPVRSVASALSVALGVGTVFFFAGLGLGLTSAVEHLFPSEARLVEVAPPAVSVSFLGAQRLDEAAFTRLSHLPGVTAAYRKMALRAPSSSRFAGEFFGVPLRLAVELSAVGVDAALVAHDVDAARFVDGGIGNPGAPVPTVVARRLLDLYNHAFAPSRKLPQLSAAMLEGFTFPVDFNRSLLTPAQSGLAVSSRVELLGFSDRVPLASLAIPLDAARRINRAAGLDAETFSGVVLEADSPARVPGLTRAIQEMGWRIDDSERRLAQAVGTAVLLTTSALTLLGLIVCGLAALNIAYARAAAVEASQRELAVMRAVGASRAEIQAVVLGHAALLGLAGGVLGLAAARLGASMVATLAARGLPALSVPPELLFFWPAWVWVSALLLGVCGALAGAWLPARRAARIEPVQVLAAG